MSDMRAIMVLVSGTTGCEDPVTDTATDEPATTEAGKRPRITPDEIRAAHELAHRREGVTAAQLAGAWGITRARALLILGRLEGAATRRAGTAFGQGSRALVYRVGPFCPECDGPMSEGRKQCSDACTNNAARRRYREKQRGERP